MAAESSDLFTRMPYKKGAFISFNPRGLDCKSTEKQTLNNLTKIKRCSYTIRVFNSQEVLPYMGFMDIGMCSVSGFFFTLLQSLGQQVRSSICTPHVSTGCLFFIIILFPLFLVSSFSCKFGDEMHSQQLLDTGI